MTDLRGRIQNLGGVSWAGVQKSKYFQRRDSALITVNLTLLKASIWQVPDGIWRSFHANLSGRIT